MITPKQASESLQVSTSTVRRWSSDFEPFLSPRKGVKRMYSTDDLAILARIKDYYAQGMNTAQIAQALPVVNHSEISKALVNVSDFANALLSLHEKNLELSEKVETLTDRLETLEAWQSLPFYKRIGKRPKP